MLRFLLLLLAALLSSGAFGQDLQQAEYTLPRRTLPLEKCLIKLAEAGAEISYRPDQIPKIALRCPGGRRTLESWLAILLGGTELTYEYSAVGYVIFPDPDLSNREFTLFGTITDARSGERLIAASVQDSSGRVGTLSNEYGLYTLTANGGRRRLSFSYVGYTPISLDLVLRGDTTLNIELRRDGNLPEVIVTPTANSQDEAHLLETRTSIGQREAREVSGLGGVADPLRVARLLAGVETGADDIGGIFIRGSEAGHNLVLLDGVPLYNLSHAAGLLSAFNNQAIRRMDLYKDGLPARFGGRIGGVLDVHTRDGNYFDYETSIGLNLLTADFTAEGPLKVGESSFLISGRNFWGGELLRRFSEKAKAEQGRTGQMDYQVYDLNVKLNQQMGPKGHLYLSLFKGQDEYSNDAYSFELETVLTSGGAVFPYREAVSREESVNWGNTLGALRYNYIFNDHFFGNFRLSYSDLLVEAAYEKADSLIELSGEGLSNADIVSGRYGSEIRQIGAAFDGQVDVREFGMVRFGGELNFHRFLPQLLADARPLSSLPSLNTLGKDQILRPVQISAYSSMSGKLLGVQYRLGLRGQLWRSGRSFFHLSPRVLLAGKIREKMSWRFTFDQSVQPLHLISSTVIGLPSDLWIPATEEFGPSTNRQIAGQFTRQLGNDWNLVAGAYYRDIRDLVNFTEDGLNWRQNLSVGNGTARGVELTLNRTRGLVSGWLNYTLASSTRDFDELINLGRPFNFRFSRQHSFKALVRYQPAERVSLTAAFRYGSGAFFSLSQVTLRLVDPAQVIDPNPITIDLTKEKNGVQLPANHRLDLNASFEINNRRNSLVKHFLTFGIYNVYNRRNPIYYDIESNYESRQENLVNDRRFKQVFIPGFLPTISYQLRIRSRPKN